MCEDLVVCLISVLLSIIVFMYSCYSDANNDNIGVYSKKK